jgi:hypothetical protein
MALSPISEFSEVMGILCRNPVSKEALKGSQNHENLTNFYQIPN